MKLLAAHQVRLGFIGLGNMGSRIAQRLHDHGYELTVFDRDNTKAGALILNGAVFANNILELARSADVILSCLTDDEVVQNVYAGPEGAFAAAQPGTVVLEMSTISPESSRELHNQAAKLSIDVMDVAIQHSCGRTRHSDVTGRRQCGTVSGCATAIRCDRASVLPPRTSRRWHNHEAGGQHAPRRRHAGDRRGCGPG
jgi:hypothetical protein